jgi:hypothetical protein
MAFAEAALAVMRTGEVTLAPDAGDVIFTPAVTTTLLELVALAPLLSVTVAFTVYVPTLL